ncbi:hypothetical protein TRIUR3_00775 [Triticum urartu]|uniref:Uncharacterized protein n=1 Tax=Triticum urartu TaxID=4572 RepID=M8B4A5_TRIUA|nr:hypothetical protein TRIUR3_00775 [Triticum urartu]
MVRKLFTIWISIGGRCPRALVHGTSVGVGSKSDAGFKSGIGSNSGTGSKPGAWSATSGGCSSVASGHTNYSESEVEPISSELSCNRREKEEDAQAEAAFKVMQEHLDVNFEDEEEPEEQITAPAFDVAALTALVLEALHGAVEAQPGRAIRVSVDGVGKGCPA